MPLITYNAGNVPLAPIQSYTAPIPVNRGPAFTAGLTRRPLPVGTIEVTDAGDDAGDTFRPFVLEYADGVPAGVRVNLTAAAVANNGDDEADTAADIAAAINASHLSHGYWALADAAVVTVHRYGTPVNARYSVLGVLGCDLVGDAEADVVDFTRAEVELTAGTGGGGAEWNIRAGGASISDGPVSFDTSLDASADAIVAAINAATSSTGYRAIKLGTATFAIERVAPVEPGAITVSVGGNATADVTPWDTFDAVALVSGQAAGLPDDGLYELGFDRAQLALHAHGALAMITDLEFMSDQQLEVFNGRLGDAGRPYAADVLHKLPWLDAGHVLTPNPVVRAAASATIVWGFNYF